MWLRARKDPRDCRRESIRERLFFRDLVPRFHFARGAEIARPDPQENVNKAEW